MIASNAAKYNPPGSAVVHWSNEIVQYLLTGAHTNGDSQEHDQDLDVDDGDEDDDSDEDDEDDDEEEEEDDDQDDDYGHKRDASEENEHDASFDPGRPRRITRAVRFDPSAYDSPRKSRSPVKSRAATATLSRSNSKRGSSRNNKRKQKKQRPTRQQAAQQQAIGARRSERSRKAPTRFVGDDAGSYSSDSDSEYQHARSRAATRTTTTATPTRTLSGRMTRNSTKAPIGDDTPSLLDLSSGNRRLSIRVRRRNDSSVDELYTTEQPSTTDVWDAPLSESMASATMSFDSLKLRIPLRRQQQQRDEDGESTTFEGGENGDDHDDDEDEDEDNGDTRANGSSTSGAMRRIEPFDFNDVFADNEDYNFGDEYEEEDGGGDDNDDDDDDEGDDGDGDDDQEDGEGNSDIPQPNGDTTNNDGQQQQQQQLAHQAFSDDDDDDDEGDHEADDDGDDDWAASPAASKRRAGFKRQLSPDRNESRKRGKWA